MTENGSGLNRMDSILEDALAGLPVELRTQIAKAIAGAPSDRMEEIAYEIVARHHNFASKAQILAIDLKEFDRFSTFPGNNGTDWQLVRDRMAFLQSALRAGIPWPKVALGTIRHFGSILKQPFHAVSQPLYIPAYQPASYDVSKHTLATWKQEVDAGWAQHREGYYKLIENQVNQLLASGQLKLFDRPRVSRNPSSKESIIEQETALAMAAKNFLLGITWAELADECPPKLGYSGTPVDKAHQKRKRANQIRMRVDLLLKHIGLPTAQ